MAKEPSRAEVLAWMERTGRGPVDAVDHFWPGAPAERRIKLANRGRQWVYKARKGGAAPVVSLAPPPEAGSEPGAPSDGDAPPRPPPDTVRPALDRVAFLKWYLAELLADLAWVRAAGSTSRIQGLASQVSDVRRQLDAARAETGKGVAIERSHAVVALELQKRSKRIAELAERAQGSG